MGRDGEKQGWRVSSRRMERFGGFQSDDGSLVCVDHPDGRFTSLALFERDDDAYLEITRGQTLSQVDPGDEVWGDATCGDKSCGDKAHRDWHERARDIALSMTDSEAVAAEAGGEFRPPHGVEVFQPCWDRETTTNAGSDEDEDYDEDDLDDGGDAVFEWEVFLVGPDGQTEPFRKGSASSVKSRSSSAADLYWNEQGRIEPLIEADEKAAEEEIVRRNAELFAK
jgi:hypothetical protein